MFSSRPKGASSFNLQKVTISAPSWTPPFPPSHLADHHQICIITPQKLTTHKNSFSNSITKTPSYAFITSHLQWSPGQGTEPNPRDSVIPEHSCKGSHPHQALETHYPYLYPPSLVLCEICIPCKLLLTYRTLTPLFPQYLRSSPSAF